VGFTQNFTTKLKPQRVGAFWIFFQMPATTIEGLARLGFTFAGLLGLESRGT
jgi:hypothetical protein